MTKVEIMAGPCGFVTTVEATKIDRKTVGLKIQTQCKAFKSLEEELTSVNVNEELFNRSGDGQIKTLCSKKQLHPTCPVTIGLLKAVEVESGMALPVEPQIKIEKN